MTQEPDRAVLIEAITRVCRADAPEVLAVAYWDGLQGCWMCPWARVNMLFGVEPDGFVHS